MGLFDKIGGMIGGGGGGGGLLGGLFGGGGGGGQAAPAAPRQYADPSMQQSGGDPYEDELAKLFAQARQEELLKLMSGGQRASTNPYAQSMGPGGAGGGAPGGGQLPGPDYYHRMMGGR